VYQGGHCVTGHAHGSQEIGDGEGEAAYDDSVRLVVDFSSDGAESFADEGETGDVRAGTEDVRVLGCDAGDAEWVLEDLGEDFVGEVVGWGEMWCKGFTPRSLLGLRRLLSFSF